MKNLLVIAALGSAILAGCGAPAPEGTATNLAPATDNVANSVDTNTSVSAPIYVAELRKTKAFVRGVHVVPGIGPVTLKLDDAKLDQAFDVASASSFVAVTPEKNLKITAIGTGNNVVSGPMPVDLKAGEDLTVVVNGVSGDVALLPLKSDSGGPDATQAKLSILHAAKGLNALKVEIDGKPFRGDVDYGEDTDYKTLAPGQHQLQISYSRQASATPMPTPTLMVNQISKQPTPLQPREQITLKAPLNVAAGKVYSAVVYYDLQKLPQLKVLEDRFADTLQNAPIVK